MKKLDGKFIQEYYRLKRKSFLRRCFHSDDNCSQKIIEAHSIQRNRILKTLAGENGHILDYNLQFYEDDFGVQFESKGTRKASTFTGFCSFHDDRLFKPIESRDYVPGNLEQEFLYSYRALAKEHHAKYSSITLMENRLKKIEDEHPEYLYPILQYPDYELSKYLLIKQNAESFISNSFESYNRLEKLRKSMNNDLDKEKFENVVTKCIIFKKEYLIASSSLFNLEYDLHGNCINNYSNGSTIRPTMLSIFPQNGNTYILLSCFKKDKKHLFQVYEDIASVRVRHQQIAITNILVTFVENVFTSLDYWYNVDAGVEKRFCRLSFDTLFDETNNLIVDPELNIFY